MNVSFDDRATAYIDAVVTASVEPEMSEHVLFIGFPISRQLPGGSKITTSINGGPLVTLGLMKREDVGDCEAVNVGKQIVYIRFEKTVSKISNLVFSVKDGELVANKG